MLYLQVSNTCAHALYIGIFSVGAISEIISPKALNKVLPFYRPEAQLQRHNFSSSLNFYINLQTKYRKIHQDVCIMYTDALRRNIYNTYTEKLFETPNKKKKQLNYRSILHNLKQHNHVCTHVCVGECSRRCMCVTYVCASNSCKLRPSCITAGWFA